MFIIMMNVFNSIVNPVMYIMAFYGFISILMSFRKLFYRGMRLKNGKMRMVLIVKDGEEIIEAVIRSIASGVIPENIASEGDIYIVDMGSSDKTVDILQRLKNMYYNNIEIVTKNDRSKVFDNFDDY